MYVDDKMVRLQLWDTAGQERFRSLIPSYIKDSSVAVVVYDITSKQSFTNVRRWITEAKQIRGDGLMLVLVGNKIDAADLRKVSTEEGQALAKELDIMFIETSAKSGINVKQLFKDLASSLPGVKDENGAGNKDDNVQVTGGGNQPKSKFELKQGGDTSKGNGK